MIDSKAITEIIDVYEKYGWQLRRVLLTKELDAVAKDLFKGVKRVRSDMDAAWFSRAPQPGGIAWEIRHLSDSPYALLENIDENADGFEDALRAVEARLREKVLKAKSA